MRQELPQFDPASLDVDPGFSFRLSEEQKQFFHDNGYLPPFKVLEKAEMEQLWNAIRVALVTRDTQPYPDSRLNWDRHLDVPLLTKLIRRPQVTHRLQGILGDDVLCWRSSWFPKKPGDEGTDWHQTEGFTEFEGRPKLLPTLDHDLVFEVTAWLAMTPSTEANGCLQVIPGSHRSLHYDEVRNVHFRPEAVNTKIVEGKKRGFYGYSYDDLKLDPEWAPDESKAVSLEMNPGEAVIFTSRCLHSSLPNSTKTETRVGYAMRYCSADVRVYPDRDEFNFFGERLPLSNYGCVLVAGQDRFQHNRMRRPEDRY